MIREVKFESQDRRINQIIAVLNENGIKDIEEANAICEGSEERRVGKECRSRWSPYQTDSCCFERKWYQRHRRS